MKKYTFEELSGIEFEDLCLDLLEKELKQRIERYTSGKDGGIDGKYDLENEKEAIIQCKHYFKSGVPTLLSQLRREEKAKVGKLKPEKYIFCTSLGLNPSNKKEIQEIFTPYIKATSDIYGKDDLNALLGKHSKIEEKFQKLWMPSTPVLKHLLTREIHGEIYSRSEDKIQDIVKNRETIVETSQYASAQEQLEQDNVIIIVGNPGSGKTTLANFLSIVSAKQGYAFFKIESINEAQKVFAQEQKQFFYFDDFLGRNFLELISDNKDGYLMDFIRRITKDKNKRFVLTSRSTILQQALSSSEDFRNKNVEKHKYIYNVTGLTQLDKAQILYNHLYFSKLDSQYRNFICADKNYLKIIEHRNYNPRIIEHFTDQERVDNRSIHQNSTSKIEPIEYLNNFISNLNNPKSIWEHQFTQQITVDSQILILLIVFNGGAISESDLRKSYQYLCEYNERYQSVDSNPLEEPFAKGLQSINGTLVNHHYKKFNNDFYLDVINPSLADYILEKYSEHTVLIKDLFIALHTINSANFVKSLFLKFKQEIKPKIQYDLLQAILKDKSFNNKPVTYQIKIISLMLERGLDIENLYEMSAIWEQLEQLQMIKYDSCETELAYILENLVSTLPCNRATEIIEIIISLNYSYLNMDSWDLLLDAISDATAENWFEDFVSKIQNEQIDYLEWNFEEELYSASILDEYDEIDEIDEDAMKRKAQDFLTELTYVNSGKACKVVSRGLNIDVCKKYQPSKTL